MRALGRALAVWVLLAACGCSAWGSGRRIYHRYARLEGDRVAGEAAAWEGAADRAPDEAARAGAHLRLALLLSHPDHPEPDYGRALEELEAYVALDPAGGSDPEVRRLRTLLEELQRCALRGERRKEVAELLRKEDREVRRRLDALRRDSLGAAAVMDLLVEEERALTREARELRESNEGLARRVREAEQLVERLAKENRELRETLERLKSLDLQMERMRSGSEAR